MKEIPADPIWRQVYVKVSPKGGDGHLSIAALLPTPQHDILSSVTQLARSSGSHPRTGIMHVRVGASHASCQPFVGGSVCLE